MSTIDFSQNRFLGTAPLDVGPDSTKSTTPYGLHNYNTFNDLQGPIGEASRNAGLMGEPRDRAPQADDPMYLEKVYNVGPSVMATDIVVLENEFRIYTKTIDMQSYPFIRAIFKEIPITRETAIVVKRVAEVETTSPILVGAQTGGPTFSVSTRGRSAYTLQTGYTHRFAHKTIDTPKGAWLVSLFLMLSAFLFDQEVDLMILGVIRAVHNLPYKVVQALTDNSKVSIEDFVGDFRSKFAIFNHHPDKALEGMVSDTIERNSKYLLPGPDVCLLHHGVGKNVKGVYGIQGNYQQKGPEANTAAATPMNATINVLGHSTTIHPFMFFTAEKSNKHVFMQDATLGSFCYQKDDLDVVGIKRYFRGVDMDEIVPLTKIIENIHTNFFKVGDDGLSRILSIKDLVTLVNKKQVGNHEALIFLAGGKNPEKLATVLGCFHDSNGAPLKKIGEIEEKFLSFQRVVNWARHMLKTGKFVNKGESFDSDDSGDDVFTESGDSSSLPELVDEKVTIKGKVCHISDMVLHHVKRLKKRSKDLTNDVATLTWDADKEDIANSVGTLVEEEISENDLDKANEILGRYRPGTIPVDYLVTFKASALSALGIDVDKFERKYKASTSKKSKEGLSGSGDTKSRVGALKNKISKIANDELRNAVAWYYAQSTDYNSLVSLHTSGWPMPWRTVIFAPFITYRGYAMAFAINGEKTGYVGTTQVQFKESYQEVLEHIYHLYCNVFIMVENQEAISRYDMVLVDDVSHKDLNTFISLNGDDTDIKSRTYKWRNSPKDNKGHMICFFESWEINPAAIASPLGYFFTSEKMLKSESIIENEHFHLTMAPLFLLSMENVLDKRTVAELKQINLFNEENAFTGIPLLCFLENSSSVFEDGSEKEHKDSHLWPSSIGPHTMNIQTGRQPPPNVVTAG